MKSAAREPNAEGKPTREATDAAATPRPEQAGLTSGGSGVSDSGARIPKGDAARASKFVWFPGDVQVWVNGLPETMTPMLEQLQAAFAQLAGRPARSVQTVDASVKGYHLDVSVEPDQVVAAAEVARRLGFGMDTITGVDWMAADQMEVVYDYFHPDSPLHVVVRTRLPRGNPELPTIQDVFPGANWHERETHEFFGIRFQGHPNLTPLLLPEDADYHPLRKDFRGVA